ncbi:DMT family transporter [Cellulomonas sp. H30R-01]|uniref:DMT family transporter n=1 Tax=Cellulomonas sp. H30R-01 TaxID=2704467 RepID=UPI001EE3CF19|nr:DMT family transporter [Cellulomonas sp. H30R-01]
MRRSDFALVALAGLLWGTGGLSGVAAGESGHLESFAVAAYRLLGGGVVLLVGAAVVGAFRGVRVSRTLVGHVVATAVLAASYQAAYFAAVERAGVATSTLVALGGAPVLVAVGTAVATRRAPARTTVVATVLALTGLAALVGTSGGAGPAPLAGVALALVSAASFAAMTGLGRRVVPHAGPVATTALAFTLGGILLAAVAPLRGDRLDVPDSATGWWLLAFLAVVPTAGAYGAYFSGLRTVPATTASLLALLEPLTATVGAVLLYDERLGLGGMIGAVLLAGAVVVLRPRTSTGPTSMVGPGHAAGQPAAPTPRVPGARTRRE